MKTEPSWIPVSAELPDRDVVVETKIDDHRGLHYVAPLKRGTGRLWFVPNGSMYVYYEPTHWRPIVSGASNESVG